MITSIWTGPGGDASAARSLRRQVLVEELGMEDSLAWDAADPYAFHLVLVMNGTPVAAGRMTYGGIGTARLDRICVLKQYRRQGIGDGLVKVLDFKAAMQGMRRSVVYSTEELLPFYGRIGYSATGNRKEAWGLTLLELEKETNDGTDANCVQSCHGL